MGEDRDRNRMVFETTETIKRAIRMRAGLDGVGPADVINSALRAYLDKEITLAEERLAEAGGEPADKKPKKRKGTE